MIPIPSGVKVWIATGHTDSRLKVRPPVPLAICFHREAVAHNRNDD
jgi:hypothetical protein